ncbi:MAG: hypothetical protein AAGF58_11195, partial [Pseudomonadota bacterium]
MPLDASPVASQPPLLPLAWRIARRELRAGLTTGLRGFRIFVLCLALGVAAIAAVGSLATGIIDGLERDGKAILGGDVALRLIYQPAPDDQLAHLQNTADISSGREMRAMARAEADSATALVEIKTLDDAYPLFGTLDLIDADDQPIAKADAFDQSDGRWGVAVDA